MADVTEVDALTGEVVERDFTDGERAAHEAVALAAAEEAATAEEARSSAAAKLEALGLTPQEITAMLGQTGPQTP